MLPKKNRLTKKEFDMVYKNGKNIRGQVGYFKVLPWNKEIKIACAVSKKAVRKSAHRTRIRRRGYVAFEKKQASLPENTGVIWFLPQEAEEVDFSILLDSVSQLIQSLPTV